MGKLKKSSGIETVTRENVARINATNEFIDKFDEKEKIDSDCDCGQNDCDGNVEPLQIGDTKFMSEEDSKIKDMCRVWGFDEEKVREIIKENIEKKIEKEKKEYPTISEEEIRKICEACEYNEEKIKETILKLEKEKKDKEVLEKAIERHKSGKGRVFCSPEAAEGATILEGMYENLEKNRKYRISKATVVDVEYQQTIDLQYYGEFNLYGRDPYTQKQQIYKIIISKNKNSKENYNFFIFTNGVCVGRYVCNFYDVTEEEIFDILVRYAEEEVKKFDFVLNNADILNKVVLDGISGVDSYYKIDKDCKKVYIAMTKYGRVYSDGLEYTLNSFSTVEYENIVSLYEDFLDEKHKQKVKEDNKLRAVIKERKNEIGNNLVKLSDSISKIAENVVKSDEIDDVKIQNERLKTVQNIISELAEKLRCVL